MQLNKFEEQLTEQYRRRYEKRRPDTTIWHETKPPIPFVGDQFGKDVRAKVLVYASAENLKWYDEDQRRKLTYWRNRKEYTDWKRNSEREEGRGRSNWFPHVHMAPVSDGTLLTAARYLMEVFGKTNFSEEPGKFIQQIAVGNYGKFSLKGGRNRDYASKPELLAVSDPYVIEDMGILQPDVVIIPRSIHLNAFKRVLEQASHKPKHIGVIYQTNTGVINRHIDRQLNKAGLKKVTVRNAHWSQEWLQHISGKIRMGRYLDWLDWRCGKRPDLGKPNWYIRHTHD